MDLIHVFVALHCYNISNMPHQLQIQTVSNYYQKLNISNLYPLNQQDLYYKNQLTVKVLIYIMLKHKI